MEPERRPTGRPRNHWTRARKDRVLKLYKKGVPFDEIARRLSGKMGGTAVTPEIVRTLVSQMGACDRRRRVDRRQLSRAGAMLMTGRFSDAEVSRRTKLSRSTVTRLRRKLCLTPHRAYAEAEAAILENWPKGLSYSKLAQAAGLTKPKLRYLLRRMGAVKKNEWYSPHLSKRPLPRTKP